MPSPAALILRILPTALLCLILTGAADAAGLTGAVVVWGQNYLGQMTPPDSVNGVSGTASAIAAGSAHSCAIQAGTGNVVCWGEDLFGETMPPDTVNGILGTATEIAAGFRFSCAIQAGTGNVVCWGRDDYGQATPPYAVNGVVGTAAHIAGGGFHSCAIQARDNANPYTGNIVCWGSNQDVGTGLYYFQATPPAAVNGASGTATNIALGFYHSCAIQSGTGIAICWGANDYRKATPPDAINGVAGTAADIALGKYHTCAIQAETGNVVCWGNQGIDFVVTPPADLGAANAIAAGSKHNCAIQSVTGNAVCWGDDGRGQATPPDIVNGVFGIATDVSAGNTHTLAIVGETKPDLDGDGFPDTFDNCSERVNPAQDDTDGDDCGNLCDADYDNSGTVGFADFGFVTSCFGTTNALCDHTEPVGGGTSGFADFGFFTSNFGSVPGPSGTTAGTTACP